MRTDMQKVIIDRPRAGGHNYQKPAKPQIRDTDADYGPMRQSMKKDKIVQWAEKSQTDVLGPLKRFLRKRVGKKWNDVWSEICRSTNGVMGSHLKDHVDWMVERNRPVGYRISGEFYVDDHGILKESETKPKTKRSRKLKIVKLNGQDYYNHQDIWYRVTVCDFQNAPLQVDDVFGFGGTKWATRTSIKCRLIDAYGKSVYCSEKQQANSKECKKLNRLTGV